MCWEYDRSYSGDWSAPRTARRFCDESLRTVLAAGPELDRIVDDALAVTSELITNAVQAECRSATLRLAIHSDHVRIAVDDDAAGEPMLQTPTRDDDHGRGLQIVGQLASRWGVTPLSTGKRVWAVLPVPARLTNLLHCTESPLGTVAR